MHSPKDQLLLFCLGAPSSTFRDTVNLGNGWGQLWQAFTRQGHVLRDFSESGQRNEPPSYLMGFPRNE